MTTITESPKIMRPPEPPGFKTWVRKNLFNSWFNSLLTIVLGVLIVWSIFSLLRWIFTTANWEPVLKFPFLYLVGQYPREQLWRVGLVLSIYSLLIGMSWRKWSGVMRVLALTYAGFFVTNLWGGLLVTMLLAIGGITISFPFGVMLALGRRSTLPIIRVICTIFIEAIRGVPLISILFLFSLILPLFLPTGIRLDRLIRALIGMTIFSAAYTAENVRGGLAAVPFGQTEAAKALGHSNFQITALIVLPQALRAVIPPIVGQFISLFKDTTLASGVAVLELLAVGRSILNSDPQYIGLQMEVYGFIAIVFWILSYMMSHASRRLESSLGVGER
jgi:general L-amino acid transport system permease protein